jgi:predicted nucleic acid-binding protein
VNVVVDASPLIALARIERLELLREMFGGVVVPAAVWHEVVAAGSDKAGARQVATVAWIRRRDVVDQSAVAALRRDLGAGEAEAIVLARELPADLLIMDEHLGRCAARDFGVRTVGLVGVLVEARNRGLLPDAGSVADALYRKAGFWLSADLRRLIAG